MINKENMDELVRLSLLYDFYGTLLKEHKRRIFEDYVLNDYSLGEIAKTENMTRQGVYDMVNRCAKELERYEERLQLIRKFERIKEKTDVIRCSARSLLSKEGTMADGVGKTLEDIEKMAGEIMAEL